MTNPVSGDLPKYWDSVANAPTWVGDVPNRAVRVTIAGAGNGSASLDAFSHLRVSNPVTLFDVQHQYDTQPLQWYDVTANGGTVTHLPNESSVRLRITTTSNSSSVRQSKNYFRYQPGRSQLIVLTTVIGAATTNVTKRVGYFDANNGIFLQQAGDGTLSFVRRTFTSGGVVDNAVAQSSWNIDKLDGTGNSGITLDITKAQIIVMDFQWLGVGRVRVGFNIGGSFVYVHEFLNSNALTTVYMSTANLPIRYEISASGAAAAQTDLIQICCAVFSEGGFEEERAYPFTANNGITTIGVTTRRPILSIRPKATFNSIVNRGQILATEFAVMVSGNPALVELVYNGTLTGASFSSVDGSSIAEFDTAGTAIAGGISIASVFAPVSPGVTREGINAQTFTRLPLTLDTTGANPINLSLVLTSFTGTATSSGRMNWNELR